MKNKILLIIAILCMLVPFVFAGLSVNAEQYVDSQSSTFFNYAFTDYVNGSYVWSGSPQFNLNYSNFINNVYQRPYYIPSYFPSALDLPLTMVYNDVGFSHNVNAGYRFTSSNDYVSRSNMDYLLHTFFVIVSYSGQSQSEVENLASNIGNQFTIDGYPLSSYSAVSIVEADIYWEVLDSNTDTGRWSVITDTLLNGLGYGFVMQFPTMQRSGVQPENDPFYLQNKFYMISYSFGNRSFNFGGSSISNGTVIAMYDIYTTNSDYTNGFDAGFDEGYFQGSQFGYTNGYEEGLNVGYQQGLTAGMQQANSTVNTNSASYQAGMQQANSTVNTNSASYQAGLIQGREDAGNLTFMSLIGAVLDAPIRAFFGYTDSSGVQHPGLFTLEILGFDMSAVILSIFTLCVIIVIIRMCLGGGK